MNLRAFSLIAGIYFLMLFSFQDIYAAPGKDKKKRMKKSEMRELISEYESKIESLEKKVSELESENENLESALADEEEKSLMLNARLQEALAIARPYMSDRMPTEVYFKVQLGAYQDLNIQESFTKEKTLQTEEAEASVKKYVIGEFNSFETAKKFESDLKKLGIKDAWLVPYKNQRRIPDDEASEIIGRDIRD